MNNAVLPPLPQEVLNLTPELRQHAFTHRSRRSQDVARHQTNERLEFLGDAVIELYVSEVLLRQFPEADEGQLTRLRAHIVRTESLASAAVRLHLGEHLVTSRGEASGEAMESEAVLADTFEAVTGAIYSQSGYTVAGQWLDRELISHHGSLSDILSIKDPKSHLQELVQAAVMATPEYILVSETGPDHAKTFEVSANIPGKEPVTGTGASKQKAEQAAAVAALARYFPEQNTVL